MTDGSSSADATDDVARRLVDAVCLEADRERVLADLAAGAGPDLADAVAVVVAHQPVTQAVLVDVLAELGVGPEATAAALDLESVDVGLLLAADPLPGVADAVADEGVEPVVLGTHAPGTVAADPAPARPARRVDSAEHATDHVVVPAVRAGRRRRLAVAFALFVVAVALAVAAGLMLR